VTEPCQACRKLSFIPSTWNKNNEDRRRGGGGREGREMEEEEIEEEEEERRRKRRSYGREREEGCRLDLRKHQH
jgi:hypothetical protein